VAVGDFDTYYPQNPWEGIEQNKRPWYVPELYRVWRQATVYNRFVTTQFNMNGPRASEMYFDTLLLPHADNDPLGLRDMWANAAYMDSKRRKITFTRYGGKFSLNRYEERVNYWLLNGRAGLVNIISGDNGLGYHMVEVLEKLARNAFLSAPPRALYGTSTGVNFNDITTSDTVTTALIDDVILGMKERGVPTQQTGNGSPGSLVCITTPGVLRDLRYESSQAGNENAWIDVMKYADGVRVIRGEVGSYHGVRFIESNRACLYNAGGDLLQTTIKAAVSVGDGSPDPATTLVDGVEYVGQPSAVHYIAVDDVTGFNVGDLVTIHVDRTSKYGVTNGLDFTDGKAMNRRIVAIDAGNNRMSFDEPITINLTTDLGSGVYGYVTKARNIHTMLFLAMPNGVVQGVSQPPLIHMPPPIDDFDMIYRFTWDAYLGYTVFEKDAFEVAYVAGSNRLVGPRHIR